ncbi:hypothetical protein Peur_062820 [Populus x canadensis]
MAVVELQILSLMCSFHLLNTFIIEFLNKSQIVKLLVIWIWLQRSRVGFKPISVSGISFCLIVVGYLFLAVAGCVPQGSRNMKEPGVSIVRKNKFVEKHLNFHLQTQRVKTVGADGVKEIWLSSEDTGAYGCDFGVNLPILLNAIVAELPSDASTMLRIGMKNPPFIREHLCVLLSSCTSAGWK